MFGLKFDPIELIEHFIQKYPQVHTEFQDYISNPCSNKLTVKDIAQSNLDVETFFNFILNISTKRQCPFAASVKSKLKVLPTLSDKFVFIGKTVWDTANIDLETLTPLPTVTLKKVWISEKMVRSHIKKLLKRLQIPDTIRLPEIGYYWYIHS